MDSIRLACVRYLNTAPLIHGLDRLQGLTLLPCAPADISGMVFRSEAELGLASIVDALRAPAETVLFPVGMIGCDGATLTVRVFSRVPLANVRVLAADRESHTSVVLARLIMKRSLGVSVDVTDYREGDPWPEAVLLIGDKVIINHPPESLYPHQLDLGLAWKELTGLPFVYAMWMARAAAADDPRVVLAARLLDRQRRHNAGRMEWLVRTYAPKAGWPLETARRYLCDLLRYEVTRGAMDAVRVFGEMARAEGLLPAGEMPRVATISAATSAPPAAR